MGFIPVTSIPPYKYFDAFTPTVPQFYWDVESWERGIKYLAKELWKLVCYADANARETNVNHDAIVELQEKFTEFMTSGFDDYYAAQIEAWINANMERIICAAIKMVFFGLTQDGYFVAFIPDSWSDIGFDTGMVYAAPTYGRLILTFEDGFGDTTYDTTLNGVYEAIAQTDAAVDAIRRTLYTEISEYVYPYYEEEG